MADGIGRIFGGSNYGVGGYVPQRKNEEAADAQAQQANVQQNQNETQVDPQKVMDFLANNNYFRPISDVQPATDVKSVDEGMKERIELSMQNFEYIYSIIADEFGEAKAPEITNVAMDVLLGIVA